MHRFRERAHYLPPFRRELLREGTGLPREFPVREGPTKEEGVGRAFVRRGQRVARDEKVPTAEAREGEHGSFADRLGPKREAPAGLRRPETEEASSGSSPAPAERQRPSDRLRSGAPFDLLLADEGIFSTSWVVFETLVRRIPVIRLIGCLHRAV